MYLKKLMLLFLSMNVVCACKSMEQDDDSSPKSTKQGSKSVKKDLKGLVNMFGLNNQLEALNLLFKAAQLNQIDQMKILLEMGANPDLIILPSDISVLEKLRELEADDEIIDLLKLYSLEYEATDTDSEEKTIVIPRNILYDPTKWQEFKK